MGREERVRRANEGKCEWSGLCPGSEGVGTGPPLVWGVVLVSSRRGGRRPTRTAWHGQLNHFRLGATRWAGKKTSDKAEIKPDSKSNPKCNLGTLLGKNIEIAKTSPARNARKKKKGPFGGFWVPPPRQSGLPWVRVGWGAPPKAGTPEMKPWGQRHFDFGANKYVRSSRFKALLE